MADKLKLPGEDSLVDSVAPTTLEIIEESLRGLRFGQVLLIVHEGAVVQVERTERKRISRNGDGA